jgi:flagellar biosynthetic protein FliR
MGTELHAPVALLYSFLLVLARIAGAVIFVPLPGIRNAPDPIRVILILAVTIALFPVWPVLPHDPSFIEYTGWILLESGFGLCIGLLIGFLADAALLVGTLAGVHAGFAYASLVDPESQADSPALSTIAQTVSSLLFITLGLHRYVIRIFAQSLETLPPGSFLLRPQWGEVVIHAAGTVFSVGLRLAFPVLAL